MYEGALTIYWKKRPERKKKEFTKCSKNYQKQFTRSNINNKCFTDTNAPANTAMVTVREAYNLMLLLLFVPFFAVFELSKVLMYTHRGKTIICPYLLKWLVTCNRFQNWCVPKLMCSKILINTCSFVPRSNHVSVSIHFLAFYLVDIKLTTIIENIYFTYKTVGNAHRSNIK